MLSLERLWNLDLHVADWIDEIRFAQTVMLVVSVMEAANYLRSFGAPLSVVRRILLGV